MDFNNKSYHIEVVPPKLGFGNLESSLELFAEKYNKVMESGFCASITDNAMGAVSFQGIDLIEELELEVQPEKIIIHLNTFHTKKDLHSILDRCKSLGIKYLLILSGDGSERLHKLSPAEIGEEEAVKSVTSVELLKYIKEKYPDTFVLGAAFNPYEPPEHEFAKLERKVSAGASFIITQPILWKNDIIDRLLEKYPELTVIIGVWMSKKLHILSKAVGYDISDDINYDPIKTLQTIADIYSKHGIYLTLLDFKSQYQKIIK